MNLSAARIFVKHVAEARRFYVDTLGLTLELDDAEHGVCILDAGGPRVIIEAVPDDASEADHMLVGRFTGLSFAVSDIQAKYRQLLSGGVEFSGPPERQYWGGWLATLRDPAGNEVQVVQPSA